jgi:hypothetical protein
MQLQSNPELERAFDYVNNTQTNIFLTGRAGTGKTTFLLRIRQESAKRMAVVAPTGVAAINAGGMTIHSLFQLPFGPYLPGNSRDAARQKRFSGEKIKLLQSLDLLVIDEISMVRADLLDGIDEVLRRYRDYSRPFGGLQLLMIGDLHQLPPVAKEAEWELLRPYYDTPYFFSSQALRQAAPVVIELKHIYRQSDDRFIQLLNKVRDRQIDQSVLDTLNSRYIPDFQPDETAPYITLSSHNATAQAINAEKLAATNGALHTYKAVITGDFPAHAYPADEVLEVKTGAQVMFVKNDASREKRYYNGKIGKITRIQDGVIYVACPGESEIIQVVPTEWENIRYNLNDRTKEVNEEVLGAFTQFPLKLAWAITIHKSQGLTFERVILDAQAAFAHGQVYVALSRCKSFEGIVLRTPITLAGIRTDAIVRSYSEAAAKNAPDEAHLQRSKTAYQQALILELFGFPSLIKRLERVHRLLLEHEGSLHRSALEQFKVLSEQAAAIFPVAEKFQYQLQQLFRQDLLPEAQPELQARIQKAAAWFAEKLGAELLPAAYDIRIVTDNKELQKTAGEALENLQKELFIKHACCAEAQKGFVAQIYIRRRTDSALDFGMQKQKAALAAAQAMAPQDIPHPALFAALKKWRSEAAEQYEVELFQILPTKTLADITLHLPVTQQALKAIKGIGKAKLSQFGAALLQIVQDYCAANNIAMAAPDLPGEVEKLPKVDSKTVSFDLFQSGKTLDEIAAERGFVRSTIEGHLAHFVELGELDIHKLMPAEDIRAISDYFADHPGVLSSEAKAHFGEKYSYGEIKMVIAHLKSGA